MLFNIPFLLDQSLGEALEHPSSSNAVWLWIIFGLIFLYSMIHYQNNKPKQEAQAKKEFEEKLRKEFEREEASKTKWDDPNL